MNAESPRPLWKKFADPMSPLALAQWAALVAIGWFVSDLLKGRLAGMGWMYVTGTAVLGALVGVSLYRAVAFILRRLPGYRRPD